jgi:glycine/D-amino acid oxidase-like deaminating enzyme/nitrite reductase/ring-hydroxylating ferredoxin subunit
VPRGHRPAGCGAVNRVGQGIGRTAPSTSSTPVDSLWTAAPSTPGFATAGALRGDRSTEVVVVGGGAAGLAIALRLQERGAEVIVLERHRVGGGVTGGSTAKVTALHGTRLSEIRRRHGAAVARTYARANQEGLADIRMGIGRYGIDCGLTAAPAVDYATTAAGARRVEAELAAHRAAGLPVEPFVAVAELPFAAAVTGAFALPDQAHIHPLRWCEGMAAAIGRDRVHEWTAVERIDQDRNGVAAVTGEGRVRAEHAVVATHAPIVDPRYLTVRCRPHRSYALALRLDDPEQVPRGMYLSVDEPVRSLRPAVVEGTTYLVVAGEGHPVADEPDGGDARGPLDALERWAREHFAVAEVVHRWAAHDQMPSDALPFVGPLVPGGRRWVATGFQKWGLTMSAVAARVVADSILGGGGNGAAVADDGEAALDGILDPTRLRSSLTGRLAADVGRVAQRYVGDHVAIRRPSRDRDALVAALEPGDGVVLPAGRGGTAVHRDADGRLHAVSAVCSHEGCLVRFNRLQTSWDCPCHGSRFSVDGEVLCAPAVAGLPRMEPPPDPGGPVAPAGRAEGAGAGLGTSPGVAAGATAPADARRQSGSGSSKTR